MTDSYETRSGVKAMQVYIIVTIQYYIVYFNKHFIGRLRKYEDKEKSLRCNCTKSRDVIKLSKFGQHICDNIMYFR